MESSLASGPRVCFKVEKVIGVSSEGNIRTYQVQWAPAWVSGFHLLGCEHLIQEFLYGQLGKELVEDSSISEVSCISVSESVETRVPQPSLDSNGNNGCDAEENMNNLQDDENFSIQNTNMNPVDVGTEYPEVCNYQKHKDAIECVKIEEDDDNMCDIVSEKGIKTNSIGQSETGPLLNSEYSEEISPSFSLINNNNSSIPWSTAEESKSSLQAKPLSSHDIQLTELVPQNEPKSTNYTERHQQKIGSDVPVTYSMVRNGSCPVCFKTFATEIRLMKHLATHNNGEKPYVCEECGKGFSRKHHLKDHLRCIHSGSKPYSCDLCQKSFAVKSNLKTHRQTIHNLTPYSCNLCGQPFTRKADLKGHLEQAHDGDGVGEI